MASTNLNSEVVELPGKTAKKHRESSRDVLAALEERVAKLCGTVAEAEGEVQDTSERVEGLASRVEELQEGMQGALNVAVDTLSKRDDALEALMTAMREEIEALKTEVCKLRRVRGAGASVLIPSTCLDVPKPKEFKGTRAARDVDNFLWSMEAYFRAMGVEDEEVRVTTASMYLADTALLWWRRRSDDRVGTQIATWGEFQAELRLQFYPEYAEDEARAKLRRLDHKGDLREYVKTFSNLMLQIPSLNEKEAFFQFMDGLKPWAKQELQRGGVQDLNKAMSTAESLVEFKSEKLSLKGKEKAVRGGEKSHKVDSRKSQKFTPRDKSELGKPWKDRGQLKCFLCDGPHLA